jgi:hypothetical protein
MGSSTRRLAVHLQDRLKNGATKDSCSGLASLTAKDKQNLRDLAQWDETQRGERHAIPSDPRRAEALTPGIVNEDKEGNKGSN